MWFGVAYSSVLVVGNHFILRPMIKVISLASEYLNVPRVKMYFDGVSGIPQLSLKTRAYPVALQRGI